MLIKVASVSEPTGPTRGKQRLRLSLAAWQQLTRRIEDPSRLPWPTRLCYGVVGIAHSTLFRMQHASYEDRIKSTELLPPIFLLGFWRSGTTLLHELFCCDSQFGFPSTYACLNPSHFLLTEPWNRRRPQPLARRPMDDMRYSWISPQEDEFALLAMGARSPYEALVFPSLMCEARGLLDLGALPLEEQKQWEETFQYFLRLLTVQQPKRMVLKSPPHGFRLSNLIRLFPKAGYVIIERNPYEIFASNLKLWNKLLDLYSLEPFSQSEIEAFVLAAYRLHEEIIAEEMGHRNAPAMVRVRFEQLVAKPVSEMERLYAELDLGDFAAVRPRLEEYAARVAGHKRNSFRVSPSQIERVDAAWGEWIQKKGYGLSHQHVTVA
jgi:omega-hydroxy-beta-dihydromenaquinone-9 sulfotransferase